MITQVRDGERERHIKYGGGTKYDGETLETPQLKRREYDLVSGKRSQQR